MGGGSGGGRLHGAHVCLLEAAARARAPTHSVLRPAFPAGRAKATQEEVKLFIYAIGHSAGDEPLLPGPITVHKQVLAKGEASDAFLCQINNDENRAFAALFISEYNEGTFPSKGFSLAQDDEGSWKHNTKQKTVKGAKIIFSLSDHYDFVEVDTEEPKANKPAAGAGAGAE